ncbi:MAG: tyrosine-type recombinase/integrase [Candidatus Bathyarchaeota archaeon]|nr:tyrosine-type recombinase/integrase [Candidatus Bathyarchaeota archaeon]
MRGLTEGIQKSQAYDTFSDKANVDSGKSEPAITATVTRLTCPQCKSEKLWRDGLRHSAFGDEIQRWLCRDCGLRFSDPEDVQKAWSTIERVERIERQSLKSGDDIVATRQICVTETKNLAAEQQKTEVLRRNETDDTDLKGKIIEYAWWLKKDGKSDATIQGRTKLLRVLVKRGANLYDPESMKEVIAKQPWSNGRKNNAVDAYSSFLKMVGGKWEAPLYQTVRKLPFIPKETEIDQLIAGCSQRMATFLQMLKETGARCGEIWNLNWEDIDFESKVVNITPEKNSNPRVVHLSNKLIEMLQKLPRNYGNRVFSYQHMPVDHHGRAFCLQRKRIAKKIRNPRLLKIHFHTFRYWKGTMLYHKTKDMYYVMQALGHKNIKNTLLYIQLEEALFQGETDYISKVAKTEKEICKLIEAGFEYVTEFEGAKIFRKRKL